MSPRRRFNGMKRSRKIAVAVLAGGASLAIAGAAFAYWTGGGAGTGSATAGTTSSITVNQTSAITGMYPGGPAAALSGNFDNPNSGSVYVTSVSASVHAFSSQADGSKPACTQADFAIGGSAPVGAQVASGTAKGSWSGLTVSMVNGSGNQDNCKGLTVSDIVIDYVAHAS